MMKWQHDGRGRLAQIGVLTPHVDFVPESEFQAMAPNGVSIHSARVLLGVIAPGGQISPKIGPDAVRAFAEPPFVDEAISLLSEVPLQVIVYAFTSSSYLLGAAADTAMRERLERRAAKIPLVIPAEAATLALKSLDCKRVALVHPPWFPAELDRLGATISSNRGLRWWLMPRLNLCARILVKLFRMSCISGLWRMCQQRLRLFLWGGMG